MMIVSSYIAFKADQVVLVERRDFEGEGYQLYIVLSNRVEKFIYLSSKESLEDAFQKICETIENSANAGTVRIESVTRSESVAAQRE